MRSASDTFGCSEAIFGETFSEPSAPSFCACSVGGCHPTPFACMKWRQRNVRFSRFVTMWAGVGRMDRMSNPGWVAAQFFFLSASCLHFSDLSGRHEVAKRGGNLEGLAAAHHRWRRVQFLRRIRTESEFVHPGGELAPPCTGIQPHSVANTLDARSRPKGARRLPFRPGELLHASYPIVDFGFPPRYFSTVLAFGRSGKLLRAPRAHIARRKACRGCKVISRRRS